MLGREFRVWTNQMSPCARDDRRPNGRSATCRTARDIRATYMFRVATFMQLDRHAPWPLASSSVLVPGIFRRDCSRRQRPPRTQKRQIYGGLALFPDLVHPRIARRDRWIGQRLGAVRLGRPNAAERGDRRHTTREANAGNDAISACPAYVTMPLRAAVDTTELSSEKRTRDRDMRLEFGSVCQIRHKSC